MSKTIIYFAATILLMVSCNKVEKDFKSVILNKNQIHSKQSSASLTFVILNYDPDTGEPICDCLPPACTCIKEVVITADKNVAYNQFKNSVNNATSSFFTNGPWNTLWPNLTSDDLAILRDTSNTIHSYLNNDSTIYYITVPNNYAFDINNFNPNDALFVLPVIE